MDGDTHLTTESRRRAVDAVLCGMTKASVSVACGVDRKTITRKLADWMERSVPEGLTVFTRPPAHRRRLRTSKLVLKNNLYVCMMSDLPPKDEEVDHGGSQAKTISSVFVSRV